MIEETVSFLVQIWEDKDQIKQFLKSYPKHLQFLKSLRKKTQKPKWKDSRKLYGSAEEELDILKVISK